MDSECAIADSCAPIHDRNNQVIGAVLVFRDVSKEYAAQQALHDSERAVELRPANDPHRGNGISIWRTTHTPDL